MIIAYTVHSQSITFPVYSHLLHDHRPQLVAVVLHERGLRRVLLARDVVIDHDHPSPAMAAATGKGAMATATVREARGFV